MDTISFLLICVILLSPMLFLISVAKAMQPPVRKSRYAEIVQENSRKMRSYASIYSPRFTINTQQEQEITQQLKKIDSDKTSENEQETIQQSNKTMTATYLNNLLDLKKFLNKFTDEELKSQDCFVLNYKEEDRDYPGTYHLESKDIQYVTINQWTIEFYENKEALNM